jgi:hypothetical protein
MFIEDSEVLFWQGKLSSGGSNWTSSLEAQESTYKLKAIVD